METKSCEIDFKKAVAQIQGRSALCWTETDPYEYLQIGYDVRGLDCQVIT